MLPVGSRETSPAAALVVPMMMLVSPASRDHRPSLGADNGSANPQRVLCCQRTVSLCQAVREDGAMIIEVMKKLLTF